jgi:surface polysaccharide O-acyltransferase-like enzyme
MVDAIRETSVQRNVSIDVLRVAMSIMVIGLHCNFLADVNDTARALLVNGLFRLAVPTFLVISGYYFFEAMLRHESKLWLRRLVVLYFLWTVLYSPFWLVDTNGHLQTRNNLIISVVVGYWHLWFLPGVIGAALMLLALRRLSDLSLTLLLVIFFAVGVLVQYDGIYHFTSDSRLSKLTSITWSHRNFLFLGFPLFCAGYLIRKTNLDRATSPAMACCLTAASILALIGEAYFNHLMANRRGGMDNLMSLLIASPALFIATKQLYIAGNSKNLARISASIFFIHGLLIELALRYLSIGETPLTLLVIALSVVAAPIIMQANRRWPYLL